MLTGSSSFSMGVGSKTPKEDRGSCQRAEDNQETTGQAGTAKCPAPMPLGQGRQVQQDRGR